MSRSPLWRICGDLNSPKVISISQMHNSKTFQLDICSISWEILLFLIMKISNFLKFIATLLKWENRGSAPPPPPLQGSFKLITPPPPFKGWKLFEPPLQQFCRPRKIFPKTCCVPPSAWLKLAPPPLPHLRSRFEAIRPLPVISVIVTMQSVDLTLTQLDLYWY